MSNDKLIRIDNALNDIYKESIKNPPKTLDGHIKNENGITNDYRGRAIYEFFQNAVDRAEQKIWIHLDTNARTFTIANDGDGFSIDKKQDRNYSDIESLCSYRRSIYILSKRPSRFSPLIRISLFPSSSDVLSNWSQSLLIFSFFSVSNALIIFSIFIILIVLIYSDCQQP